MKPSKKSKFKVGQWVFAQHKLKVVEELGPNGNVSSLSDGYCRSGSNDFDDECFALDKRGKLVSDAYESVYNRIHATKCNSLNYPAICSWFEEEWRKAMLVRDKEDMLQACYARLHDFERGIMNAVDELKTKFVHGVRLIR